MNKKLILTYGISEKQNTLLKEAFSEENVKDVTDAFTDLIALPAAAVVVNADTLTKEEKSQFNLVYEHDLDTCITMLGEMEDKRFVCVLEENEDCLSDTIEMIKERYNIPAEYEKASAYMNETVDGVKRVLKGDPNTSFKSQIGHMEGYSISYNMLTKLLDHVPEVPLKERYPYRVKINSLLVSAMLASGLMTNDELDSYAENSLYDIEWIRKMAEFIGNN